MDEAQEQQFFDELIRFPEGNGKMLGLMALSVVPVYFHLDGQFDDTCGHYAPIVELSPDGIKLGKGYEHVWEGKWEEREGAFLEFYKIEYVSVHKSNLPDLRKTLDPMPYELRMVLFEM